jgi:hypothetical protein
MTPTSPGPFKKTRVKLVWLPATSTGPVTSLELVGPVPPQYHGFTDIVFPECGPFDTFVDMGGMVDICCCPLAIHLPLFLGAAASISFGDLLLPH